MREVAMAKDNRWAKHSTGLGAWIYGNGIGSFLSTIMQTLVRWFLVAQHSPQKLPETALPKSIDIN